jgi:hypothetical protein
MGAVGGDDFAVYLRSADAKRAQLGQLETLASMRQALGRPMPVDTYIAIRAVLADRGKA